MIIVERLDDLNGAVPGETIEFRRGGKEVRVIYHHHGKLNQERLGPDAQEYRSGVFISRGDPNRLRMGIHALNHIGMLILFENDGKFREDPYAEIRSTAPFIGRDRMWEEYFK